MASITKNNGENSGELMGAEEDQRADDAPEQREEKEISYRSPGPGEPPRDHAGFFHVYKSGQGYWTRMGTVGAAALLILLIGHFFYTFLPTWSDTMRAHPRVMIGIVLAIVAGLSLLAFRLMNKPQNADFLIATDSEMKKVNWTSRAELIGSTKIVIIFVFLISALLFGIDIVFGYLFYFLKVLKQPPF
jgi:preprotein translocase subunit SecE